MAKNKLTILIYNFIVSFMLSDKLTTKVTRTIRQHHHFKVVFISQITFLR